MSKQPDQMLHDEVFKLARGAGLSVYLSLPDDKAPYPFVVMGETQLVPIPTKSFLLAEVSLSVHVWGKKTQRKQVSDMLGQLLVACGGIRQAGGHSWAIKGSDSHLMKDDSTLETLYHGVLNVDFNMM